MNHEEVIVIGAGIGGLATAIQLARNGHKVTIFEKNSIPGGRCQHIHKDGHVFDTGPTMYLFPQIYSDFFTHIGEDINKHLTLLRADPSYHLFFPNQPRFVLTPNQQKMRFQLEKIERGSFDRYLAYLNNGSLQYDLAIKHLTNSNLRKPWDYFNFANLTRLLRTKSLFPHYWYTSQFFRDPRLRTAFTFQDSYLSLDPFTAPSIYSLFAYSEQIEGSFLPQGGMYQVILALEKIAKKLGVKIKYDSPVAKINTTNSRATGITLANNSYVPAELVVVNADLTYAINNFLPIGNYAKRIIKKKYSCSALVFHWGLDKKFEGLATHNLFFSRNYRESFDQVINHADPPAEPHFYVQAPTRTDKSRAPASGDTLTVMVPINHLHPPHPVNWTDYQSYVKQYILKNLCFAGFPDISKHTKFELSYHQKDWQDYLNLPFGSIYGLHHNLSQLGYLRPKRQHHQYKNVFFVGASTHPGSGLPTVLLSAKYTVEAIKAFVKLPTER